VSTAWLANVDDVHALPHMGNLDELERGTRNAGAERLDGADGVRSHCRAVARERPCNKQNAGQCPIQTAGRAIAAGGAKTVQGFQKKRIFGLKSPNQAE